MNLGDNKTVCFANPHNVSARVNLSIAVLDQDVAPPRWGEPQQVYAGGSGYVTSTAVPGKPCDVGLLFEKDGLAALQYVQTTVRGAGCAA